MKNNPSENIIYQGNIVTISTEIVTSSDGLKAQFEYVRHPGGSAIVAINNFNQICLIKQYRHILKEWIWELPAGKLDNQEEPASAAQRELKEETGHTSDCWTSLGYFLPSPGVFDEKLFLFLAENLTTGDACLEPHEMIELHWVDIDTAIEWCFDDTIKDAKTIIGIQRYRHHLKQKSEV